ncbi:MAG: imidazole glycerol phosphate synthase subunit HisH [Sterolibacterium sp.]|nr:imidazole glycerol phosphate synthase subunit HisH [Sterolibacterium sp.]
MAGTVAVVDYGMGNLRSVVKALEHVANGERIVLAATAAEVAAADRIVVPGQGAMPDCMHQLAQRGLRAAVVKAAAEKPFLGICVGLQLLFGAAEEGQVEGLGILPGRVPRFPGNQMFAADGSRLKVPHMGWNDVQQQCPGQSHPPHPLWHGIAEGARFYFVHSYYVAPADMTMCAGMTCYGIPFTSAVARDNIFAVQFHPEKSARDGLQLLANFMRWKP